MDDGDLELDQQIFEDDDDVKAWREFMLARKGYRAKSHDNSSSTDLDGCSISRKASSSLEPGQEVHDDNDSAYQAFQFVDSATDSGQTSDNDSRVFRETIASRPKSPRKQLVANLLHEIYGPNHADEYSDDLEETRNLVRRASTASILSSKLSKVSRRKVSRVQIVDYTSWRLEKYGSISQTLQKLGYSGTDRLDQATLQTMDTKALRNLLASYDSTVETVSQYLVQELKRKDYRQITQSKHCLIISAALQSLSPASPTSPTPAKPGESTKMRFSIAPPPGDGYLHWLEGMRAVLRLPGGLPSAFRRTMWTTIANRYIAQLAFDWDKVKRLLLHDRFNPDEEALGAQIVKDLHRTGITDFCGDNNDRERYVLKRVLLAYARFRPSVGYCQGFNIIAAVILDVVDKDEEEALKIMIYLIEHVLPADYFANDLLALSVDLCVFTELVQVHMPDLYNHLDHLRLQSLEERGANGGYEPPLTNLFTIQWFLTLYATCLPRECVYRVWDCVFLFGSAILMKTSLALLRKLEKFFLPMTTAFDFYTVMSDLQQKILDGALLGPEEIIQEIFTGPEFDLRALRTKHTNSPFDNHLRPALKPCRSLHGTSTTPSSPQRHPENQRQLLGGFGRRRTSSHTLVRRPSSASDAETDAANLKKKYDEYTKEHVNAKIALNHTEKLKQNIAGRRGSIFLEPLTVSGVPIATIQPVATIAKENRTPPAGVSFNPFKFPLVRTENVRKVVDQKEPTVPVRKISRGLVEG